MIFRKIQIKSYRSFKVEGSDLNSMINFLYTPRFLKCQKKRVFIHCECTVLTYSLFVSIFMFIWTFKYSNKFKDFPNEVMILKRKMKMNNKFSLLIYENLFHFPIKNIEIRYIGVIFHFINLLRNF